MTSLRDESACDQERGPIAISALEVALTELQRQTDAIDSDSQKTAVRLHLAMQKAGVILESLQRHAAAMCAETGDSGAIETAATGEANPACDPRLNPNEITIPLSAAQFDTIESAAGDLMANTGSDIDQALNNLLMLGAATYNISAAILRSH